MKKIKINEKWCLACHLCEYNCAFANSGSDDMVKALKGISLRPRIHVEESGSISFAVSCRHCEDPKCIKACITGAMSKKDGVVTIDKTKCVGCCTCVLVCPYGAVTPSEDGTMLKCELCTKNADGTPACVSGCPNKALELEII